MAKVRFDGYENDADAILADKPELDAFFAAFLDSFRHKISGIAYKITRDKDLAEDAVTDTCMNVLHGLRNYRGDAQFGTWVARVATNVALGYMRGKKFPRPLGSGLQNTLPDTKNPLPDASLANCEARERIGYAFAEMSERQADVVYMHDYEGRPIGEIAEILRVPPGTVKSRLFYGREEFRNAWNADFSFKYSSA